MVPVLFEIPLPWGTAEVRSYGFMLGLSLVLAWYLVPALGRRRDGLGPGLVQRCFLVTAVCAVLGSRVLHVVMNFGRYETPLEWFDFGAGGLVAYGGFLGGFLGALAYLRWIEKRPILPFADAVAPTLGSGLFLTRIGCYLEGCDFGARLPATSPAWLQSLGTFPRWADGTGSPAWLHHVSRYGLPPGAPASFPVHPAQLYESLLGLALFAVTLLLWRRRRFRGQILLVFAIAYGSARWFLEGLRDDPQRGGAFGFSTSQLVSMAIVPAAVFFHVRLRRRA